ncbi:MAG: PEGA domain-containing protein, partial [Thermoanaerobaculia bacterium]
MRSWQLNSLLVGVAWALVAAGSVAAQPPTEPIQVGGIVEEDLAEDVEALLAEAEEVFRAGDQPGAVPLFERIIQLLERRRAEGALDPPDGEWLTLSLFRRAEARHNLLDEEGATADLTAIVRFDPAWDVPDGYMVSRKLTQLLGEVRDAETGVLDPLIEPADAEVSLDGEPLGPLSGPRRVLAGERRLLVRRPGYDQVEQPLTVPAGESVALELTLERTSAVVRLTTRPAGVEVVLGGEVLGLSEPAADGGENDPSAELSVAGLQLGEQRLTLRKTGYRPVEIRIEIAELADYSVDPSALERTRGTVTIFDVPAAARLVLDGELQTAARQRPDGLRLELPPGTHELRVEAGAAGLFERRFELADRQLVEIRVRLRPGLVLLGVLGGDRVAATDL